MNRNTAILFYHKLREVIFAALAAEAPELLAGEIEVDESYFGGHRKGKRGRGAAGKVPVFGLLGCTSVPCPDRPRINRALESMDGFPLREQGIVGLTKGGVAKIGREEAGQQQPAKGIASLERNVTASRAAEAVQDVGCRTPTRLGRCGDPQQRIPPPGNGAGRHNLADNRLQTGGDLEAAGQVEFARAKPGQTRTKVEPDKFGQRHGKVGMPVPIESNPFKLDFFMAQRTLNRCSSLPPAPKARNAAMSVCVRSAENPSLPR